MIKKNFGKVLLASALTIGGLGVSSFALPTQQVEAASTSVVEGTLSSFSSPAPNVLFSNIQVRVPFSAPNQDDFATKHIVRFVITDSSGRAVHQGSLNRNGKQEILANRWDYIYNANISTANLIGGKHYRITLSMAMDDGLLSKDSGQISAETMSQHFYLNADRTISDIRYW